MDLLRKLQISNDFRFRQVKLKVVQKLSADMSNCPLYKILMY